MKDLRPISLYNVLYRILAKVLANRIKPVLPKLISKALSTFVPGRSNLYNILVAFEMIHYLKRRKHGKLGDVALKIDISKAYDCVHWGFLQKILLKFGFHSDWVNMIMMCIFTVSYSILVNDALVGPINPHRGLRHGDLLSPYLFYLML